MPRKGRSLLQYTARGGVVMVFLLIACFYADIAFFADPAAQLTRRRITLSER